MSPRSQLDQFRIAGVTDVAPHNVPAQPVGLDKVWRSKPSGMILSAMPLPTSRTATLQLIDAQIKPRIRQYQGICPGLAVHVHP
eukprot:1150478-Pelagomonas_calceolata.AAC.9